MDHQALMEKRKQRIKRTVIIAGCFSIGMLGFGFALVPIYNKLCKSLGINGKTTNTQDLKSSYIDTSRLITVEFIGNVNNNLLWKFYPLVRRIDVHPGANTKSAYFAENLTDHAITIQAIPSITPGLAAIHFKKTECFCFTQQTLKAHQSMVMPLIFHVDTTLPKDIIELTLSYTLFVVKKKKNHLNST